VIAGEEAESGEGKAASELVKTRPAVTASVTTKLFNSARPIRCRRTLDLRESKPVMKLVIQSRCLTPMRIAPDTSWFVAGESDPNKSRTTRISVVKIYKK
jgi:hypothetical protein